MDHPYISYRRTRQSAGVALFALALAACVGHAAERKAGNEADHDTSIGSLLVSLPPIDENASEEDRAQRARILADFERWVREEQAVTDALLTEFSAAVLGENGKSFGNLVAQRLGEATRTRGDRLREYQRFELLARVLQSREQFGKAEVIGHVLAQRIGPARSVATRSEDAEQLLLLEAEIHATLLQDVDMAAAVIEHRDRAVVGNSAAIQTRQAKYAQRQRQRDEIAAASAALRDRMEVEKEEGSAASH